MTRKVADVALAALTVAAILAPPFMICWALSEFLLWDAAWLVHSTAEDRAWFILFSAVVEVFWVPFVGGMV